MLTYGSVCSGIEAATVAWHPLGWTPAWFAEVDPFPSAVLAHHYPGVPNHGDLRQLLDPAHPVHADPIDVLVGGTPCQDFSVAGLRAGIDGERGNLTLDFVRLVGLLRPRWVVWENVPGVLSSDGGRALGAFLGSLAELGYGFAYRVLDAQYFGLAQRRKRVFVVGHSGGDWRRAAQVLLEPESVRRDSPPRREAGTGVAGALGTGTSPGGGWRVGADEAAAGHIVAHALRAEGFDASEDGTGRGTPLVAAMRESGPGWWMQDDISGTLDANMGMSGHGHRVATVFQTRGSNVSVGSISGTLGSNSDRASGSAPMVATWPAEVAPSLYASMGDKMGLKNQHVDSGAGHFVPTWWDGEQTCSTLMAHGYKQQMPDKNNVFAVCVPVDLQNGTTGGDVAGTLDTTRPTRGGGQAVLYTGDGVTADPISASEGKTYTHEGSTFRLHSCVATPPVAAVRRLTPRECERLQGFPDDYTAIPHRGKPVPDGPRYKALGNSMAVPVMRWIGQRIALVDALD